MINDILDLSGAVKLLQLTTSWGSDMQQLWEFHQIYYVADGN